MFKTGDKVKIKPTLTGRYLLQGEVICAVSYVEELGITTYRIRVEKIPGLVINAPSNHMELIKEYNGNEVSNWADIRHIWKPKNDNTTK